MSGKWESSGATEHTKECHGKFDWLHSKTIRISSYMYERKIREAGEISQPRKINEKCKTFAVLNRDNGNYVKTSSWKTLFMKMVNHQNVPYDVKIMTLTFATFWLTFVTSG